MVEEFNGIVHCLQWQLVPVSLLLASICVLSICVLIMLLQHKYIIVNHSKIFIIIIVSCSLLLVSVHHSLTTAVGHYSG